MDWRELQSTKVEPCSLGFAVQTAANLGRIKDCQPVYIFEFHDHPVGTVNIDGDILSYTIAPESRGHGLGTLMLALVKDRHGPLKCQVKPDNVKSIKAATKAGHLVILDH